MKFQKVDNPTAVGQRTYRGSDIFQPEKGLVDSKSGCRHRLFVVEIRHVQCGGYCNLSFARHKYLKSVIQSRCKMKRRFNRFAYIEVVASANERQQIAPSLDTHSEWRYLPNCKDTNVYSVL